MYTFNVSSLSNPANLQFPVRPQVVAFAGSRRGSLPESATTTLVHAFYALDLTLSLQSLMITLGVIMFDPAEFWHPTGSGTGLLCLLASLALLRDPFRTIRTMAKTSTAEPTITTNHIR